MNGAEGNGRAAEQGRLLPPLRRRLPRPRFVAAGRLDGYWERNLQPWDIAAGQIMVREAEGRSQGSRVATIR
jgi:hypothetical protein